MIASRPAVSFAGRGKELLQSRVSWGVVLTILLVHGVVEMAGGTDFHESAAGSEWLRWMFETFSLDRRGIFDGKLWKLFSYALLHGSWIHVGVNAACVLFLGARLEATVGPQVVAGTLGGGVLAGALMHLAFGTGNQAAAFLLVGISGGAVALLLLLTTLSPGSRMWPLPVSGRSLGMGILIAETLLALMNPVLEIPGLSQAGRFVIEQFGNLFVIGHACHVGGGLWGLLVGRWILRPRPSLARLQRQRSRREAKIR